MHRLALIVLISLGLAWTAMAVVVLPSSLTRQADPVIVPGADLADLHGLALANLRFYSMQKNQMKPIPWQIDRRNEQGDYLFPYGPKADPKAANPVLTARDELVFMIKDAGASAPVPFWPEGWDKAVVLELEDPTDGGRGWACLLHFPENPPPPSPVDYVQYNNDTTTITAQKYRMSFHPQAPIGIGALAITEAGGGDGQDMVDRLKIRVRGQTVFGFSVYRHEEQFSSKTIAWIDGPVRVIRRTRNRIILFWKIPSPSSDIDNVYYGNQFRFPTRVELPFDTDAVFKSASFRVSTDLLPAAKGRVFRNEHNPDGVVLDGKMSEAEKNLDPAPYKWGCVTGAGPEDSAGWLNRMLYDKEHSPVHPSLYYIDDEKTTDSPEDVPGEIGDIGYNLESMIKLKKGYFELVSVMYHLPSYSPETIQRLLDAVDRPITVSVRPATKTIHPEIDQLLR